MSIKDKLKAGGSKAVGSVLSVVLTVGLMPLPAFALDLSASSVKTQAATAKDSKGYVIAAAFAAAEPAPEMLGLNNPNYRNTGEATVLAKIYGDETINSAVDPYLYNYRNDNTATDLTAADWGAAGTTLTPQIVVGGRNGGPMAALTAYDTDAADASKAAQNLVWKYHPHIIVGTGSSTMKNSDAKVFYSKDAYVSEAQLTAMGADSGYYPLGVAYNNSRLDTFVDTIYYLAEDAAEVLANDNSLKTRYDNPLEIAKNYERYCMGMKGYVLKAIDSGAVDKKTVAVVTAYNATSKTYTLATDNVQEGTAPTNRYLEGVMGVANNYYETVGGTATADQLKKGVDLIIVNGDAGDGSSGVLSALSEDSLLSKTYWTQKDTQGALFKMTVNSTENGQNVGRILPCLYPELLTQSDMIAYWYENFYHIKSGQLKSIIDSNMDGVRNWAADGSQASALTVWNAETTANYNKATVQSILQTGTAYLYSKNSSNNYLALSKDDSGVIRLAEDASAGSADKFPSISVTAGTSINKTIGDAAFSLGASVTGGGTLSFTSSNTDVATVDASTGQVTLGMTAGTTTITISASKATASGYVATTASKKVTLNLKGASKISLASQSKPYTGKTLAYSGAVSKSGSTGAVTYAYYSNAACTVKATPLNAGTYYVKATLAANTGYWGATSAATTFTITKAANSATAKKTSVSSNLKVKNLKKKAATIALPKVTASFGTAKWAVSTKDKKKVLSLTKAGKVQVKKGAKKGTYTIKLKASVKGTTNYAAAATKVVTVKVKVK